MRVRLVVAALGAAGGLLALPAFASDVVVTANLSNTFAPGDVTVLEGDSVTWANGGGEHNVKFEDGQLEQPPAPAPPASWPESVRRTFTAPGSYRYYCENHGGPGGVGMSGTVTVTPPSGAPPPDAGTTPAPASPTRPRISVTLRASDPTPRRGQRIRLFGSARPRRDGLIVYLQRRGREGSFRTVARARLRAAEGGRSRYSRRVRISRDAVLRAHVRASADHAAGTSARRRIDVR